MPAGVVTFSTPVGHWISVVGPVLICLRRCHTTAGDGQAAAIVAALVAAVSVRVAALAVVGLASVVAVAAVCVCVHVCAVSPSFVCCLLVHSVPQFVVDAFALVAPICAVAGIFAAVKSASRMCRSNR